MIVSFSVSNFRSFCSEQTFSLVASNRVSGCHESHATSIPNSRETVLKTAVIYGANGAGKSNLFKALRYLKSVALEPRTNKASGTGREVFRFSEVDELSGFDLQFVAAQKLYRFGFKVDDLKIVEEWLVHVVNGREKPIYERITGEDGKVIIRAKGLKKVSEKLAALATVGGPQNQSFLATIHANLDESDIGDNLNGILKWFYSLILIAPDEAFAFLGEKLARDSDFLDFASNYLRLSSTGVNRLQALKNEIAEDELKALIPEKLFSQLLKELYEEKNHGVAIKLPDGNELMVEKTDDNHFYRIKIQSAHEHQKGHLVPLDLSEESDGTRRLLNLIPALYHLRTSSAVYFIDEIDRSMHPLLVWKFLEFFLKSKEKWHQQVIVTTHESNLLDLELLRRDEIWFTEKDADSATRLYSLTDFKVRNDLEIRKHYLQGRFGAIPFLGNIDHLLIEESQVE